MRQHESYKCNECGNIIELTHVGGGKLHCCGKEMQCITTDLTSVVLMKAFAGESMARNKYEYFARIAQKESYRDIAEHFQRAANNEKMHAKLELKAYNVLNYDKEFGNTSENLQYAIDGESYENTTMYPNFAKVAKDEGHLEIARMLDLIGKVEIEHENMYRRLKERLDSGKEHVSNEEEEWICEECGHIHRGKKALKICPVCKHPLEYQSRLNSKK